MSGENVKTDQTSNQDSGAWSNFDNFAGERNVNDKTGKERTFSEFDLYPRQPGESSEEYGARQKDMHEKTAKYMAEQAAKEEASRAIIDAQNMRTKDYLGSDFGKKELDAEASYDRIADKLERAVQEGRMAKEHADRLLERKLNSSIKEIDGIRQDFEDSKTVGPEEDQEAYEKWLEERGFKEEPATKKTTAEDDTPKSVEESKAEESKGAKEEKVDTPANVIDEAKERLIKELGPIIYDQVMMVVAGEVDRIFSEITLEPKKEVSDEKAESKEGSQEDILARINEINRKLGEESLGDVNESMLRVELDKVSRERDEIRAREGIFRVGGQKGIDILTGDHLNNNPEAYSDWWNNTLNNEGRKTIRQIVKKDDAGFNKKFINWLKEHDREQSWIDSANGWFDNEAA